MNMTAYKHYILLLCICLSAVSGTAQTGKGASDARAAGFNGPVKKVVYYFFVVNKNADIAPIEKEPFTYSQPATLLITSVSSYNKQGMATRGEEENCTSPSTLPVREYEIINNGLGKRYDDLNRPIGHTTQSWSNGQTLVYKSFDRNNQLKAEVVRYYNNSFKQDSCIAHYTDGSFRKIGDYFQYKDRVITIASTRTDAEGRNTLSQSTMRIETKDRYGNVLRQTASNNDGQQYIMEYEYTYYDTPEEVQETIAEKMLLPDGQYSHAGIYETETEDGYLRVCLFANGRYCFQIMANQILTDRRGSYYADKNLQITFQADRPDTTRFYVYGRHNATLQADKQQVYFFDNGRMAMEHMLFATGTRPFDSIYNNAYSLKKGEADWYVKETGKSTDRSLWLYELLFSRLLYRFDFNGPCNEWRIMQNPDADKETVGIFLRGAVTNEGITIGMSLSQNNQKEWRPLGLFSKKAVSILPHFLEKMRLAEPREIFVAGLSYKRVYPNQVTSVKDGQLRYKIAPEPYSNVEKVVELKTKNEK